MYGCREMLFYFGILKIVRIGRMCRFALFIFMASFLYSSQTLAVSDLNLTARTDSVAGQLGANLLREAYQRMGVNMRVHLRPGNRAIAEANNGTSDGEVIRIKRVLSKYQNLRLVPESLLHLDAVIGTKDTKITVKGWDTVKRYSAVTVMGYRSIQNRIKDQEHIYASSVETAIKILNLDRVKILVLSRFDLIRGLQKTGLKNITILDPPVSRVPLYHMLHKSKESLIPKINQVLIEMKADGSHQKMIEAFIAKLSKGKELN